ncbi:MAG: TGS domain-containing protein, partial [Pseudomonadota bacterium]|nr:TGS domain-containing protein [Pseudomonadota bacterium]
KEQQWISNLLSIQKDSGNPQEYLQSIKSDLNPGKVYVFTPKGKIIDLPKKSTTIDYAYAIHTDLGNNYSTAKIDDKLVSPNTILKNGQRVEIITKENLRPDPSWLNFVITEKARHSIRAALKSIKRKDAVRLGKKLLNSAFQDFGFSISEIPDKTLKLVLNEYNTNKITDLYCDIGLGERIAKLVAMRIVPTNASQNQSKNSTTVLITGTEGLALSFAKCCYPVPGDNILGKISQDKGIVVHRNQCKSVSNTKKRKDEIIDLSWDNEIDDVFDACIKIEVENKRGVLASISSEIAQSESNIVSVTYDDTKQTGHNNMTFVVTVDGLKSLNKLITKLRKTNHVLTVNRKKS